MTPQQKRDVVDLAQRKARHTRWLRGWDDALIGLVANPYQREDYRRDYERGHESARLGNPLPRWYVEKDR